MCISTCIRICLLFHIHIHLSPYSDVCFVFCSIFVTIFLFSFLFFYKFNRHLLHGAYCCTHNLAPILILCFLLHLHFCNSCVCVCQLVFALSSSSIFLHIYHHICMYICFGYFVVTTYILCTPIIIRLCVPAPRGWARCWHNCDSMFKGLCFNILTCLCFLQIHTYHVHIKNVQFCEHLPLTKIHGKKTGFFAKTRLLALAHFLAGQMISFQVSKYWFLVTPSLGWFKCPKTEGMARARAEHLSEGRLLKKWLSPFRRARRADCKTVFTRQKLTQTWILFGEKSSFGKVFGPRSCHSLCFWAFKPT